MGKYLCKNYGSCPKADARELIELPPGAEAVCPECAFKLEEVPDPEPRVSRWIYVAGAVAVIALAGGGGWYWLAGKSSTTASAKAGLGIAAPAKTSGTVGATPDAKALEAQKKDADRKIADAGGAGAAKSQAIVIAQEYIKAAVPLMQAGKWDEANAQLLKAAAENPDEPLIYYNQAIIQLKQGKQKDALAALDLAFQKGFKDFAALEADSDLKPLRGLSEYTSVVAKYKAK